MSDDTTSMASPLPRDPKRSTPSYPHYRGQSSDGEGEDPLNHPSTSPEEYATWERRILSEGSSAPTSAADREKPKSKPQESDTNGAESFSLLMGREKGLGVRQPTQLSFTDGSEAFSPLVVPADTAVATEGVSHPLCDDEERDYLFVDNHDGTGYLSATQRLEDGSYRLGETVMLAQLGASVSQRSCTSPLPQQAASPLPHQTRLVQYEEGETAEAERQLDREDVRRAAAPSRADAPSFSLCRLPSDGNLCFEQTVLLGPQGSLSVDPSSPLPQSLCLSYGCPSEGSQWREGAPDPVRIVPAPEGVVDLAELPAAGWAPVFMSCWQTPDFRVRRSDYAFEGGSPIPKAPEKEEAPHDRESSTDSDDELFVKTATRREGSVSRLSMSFSLADRSAQSPLPLDHSVVQNLNRRLSMSGSTLWNAPNQRFGQSFIGLPPGTPLDQSTRSRMGSSVWGSPLLARSVASPLPTTPEPIVTQDRAASPSRCTEESARPSTLMTSLSFQRSAQTDGLNMDHSNSIPLTASVVSGMRFQVNSRRTSDATTYTTSMGASRSMRHPQTGTAGDNKKMSTSFRTTYCRKAATGDGLPLTRGTLGQSSRGSPGVSQRQRHQDPKLKKGFSPVKKEPVSRRTTTDAPDTSVFLPWSPLTITPDHSLNMPNSTAATEPPTPMPTRCNEEENGGPSAFSQLGSEALASVNLSHRPSTSISTTSTTEGLFSAEALQALRRLGGDDTNGFASFLQDSLAFSNVKSVAVSRASHSRLGESNAYQTTMEATVNHFTMTASTMSGPASRLAMEEPEPHVHEEEEDAENAGLLARRSQSSKRQPSLQQRSSTNVVLPEAKGAIKSMNESRKLQEEEEEGKFLMVEEQESVGI